MYILSYTAQVGFTFLTIQKSSLPEMLLNSFISSPNSFTQMLRTSSGAALLCKKNCRHWGPDLG